MEIEQLGYFNREKTFYRFSSIESLDGRIFSHSLHHAGEDNALSDLPQMRRAFPDITRLAVACFPNWTDNGQGFEGNTLPNAKTLSLVRDVESRIIVGFNIYTLGQVDDSSFMHLNYVGIDPEIDEDGKPRYRRQGLMERTSRADMRTVSPDIFTSCSAAGEVHLALNRASKQTGRIMYPTIHGVPPEIGKLAARIYGIVNGADAEASVDPATLVRHGKSAYRQGEAQYPLFGQLNMTENDGVVIVSLTKALNDRLAPHNSLR